MQIIQGVFQPVMSVEGVELDPDAGWFQLKASGGGFLAKMFGLGTTATATIDPAGFRLQKSTFGADENVYVPLHHIASTVRIVSKPLELLVLGLFTLPIWGLGLIFIILYFFSKKRLVIGVLSSGGTLESLKIKADEKTLKSIRQGGKILKGYSRKSHQAPPGQVPASQRLLKNLRLPLGKIPLQSSAQIVVQEIVSRRVRSERRCVAGLAANHSLQRQANRSMSFSWNPRSWNRRS